MTVQPAVTTYYADFYNSLEAETPADYGQVTNDGTVARTETIDGQEINLTACLITASEYPELIGRTVYGNIDDMQYIGTDTKIPTYIENEGAVVNYGYAVISREPIPHPEPTTYSFTINISDEESPINVGSYAEGAEVTYTFDRYFTEDQNQHWEQSITPSDLNYTFDLGSHTYDEDAGEWITENASISFTMPASDVTFELVYVNLYEVTVNDESAGSYAEGSSVNISIPGPVDSITPNDLEYTYDSGTGDFSFTMPAQSVSIYTTAPKPEPDPENP